ncbi:MAG TPA: adenylosuccinate lyase [Deltaproteobacteria bacterium]|nr:MAG: adenylosuccinate lyase [Deltaproteobacteria bacterium GWA2_45_12]HBF13078.1 adenylosuccinate lyase [Deltaproteobacteria bacterium]
MIPRYSRSEMARIWEPENKFQIWLEIELLALEALEEASVVPKDVSKKVRAKAKFNIERIDQLERELKHDVIAFLTSVSEFVGPEARYIHRGFTSSDILDTALAVQLTQASDLLLAGIDRLLSVLKLRAHEFKNTLTIGRSHGIHGEPVTFGWKLAQWYEEMKRNRGRLEDARETIAVGMLSGAMGTFAHTDLQIEEYVCAKLGLKADPITTQVISRDRHAYYFQVLSLVGSTIEKMAVEIRHLQRTEVLEVEEYFSPGQKGSSAMPHKRNPVLSENVTGLARLLRGYALTAIENVPLWHERDISHSSAERVIAPDATIALDFMIHRMAGIIEKLVVYPQNMKKNLDSMKGMFFSQRILIALTDKGCSREDAYRLVQTNAMKVWDEGADFAQSLKSDSKIMRHLSSSEIDELLDINHYLRNIDAIFNRVFKE